MGEYVKWTNPRILVRASGLSDIGRKREENEDAYSMDDDGQCYVVSDGMGGHRAGEIASRLVVDTVLSAMRHFRKGNPVPRSVRDEDLSEEANQLLASIQAANLKVFKEARNTPDLKGMGATVAALTFTPTTVITANVGDTAIFLYRQGSLEPLYVPHTVDAERLPSDPRQAEVLRARYRHILTKAMGLERSVQPEVFEVKVFSGDVFVLASDGITDVLEESEIVEVLAGTDRPQVICEELVQRALDAGGADNATVVAIRCQVRKTDFKTIWKALNTPVTPWGRK